MNCFVLVINRILELWNRPLMKMAFGERRAYAALLIPLLYGLYFCFFTQPLIFNSDNSSWFFFTYAPNHTPNEFYNYPHTANNLFVVAVTCLLYVQYSRILLRFSKGGRGLSRAQKSFFLQCTSICMINLICALVYVYMQFFPTSSYLVYIGHICWQLGNGEQISSCSLHSTESHYTE
ncbi:hypothetical protein ANCCAN_15779 [Ancylostoma caninum]|uniref:Serpentine receptor class gamma n=1 Tax=Ancylostoma caninum TaxID=29170 RepID=A0A368G4T0_ANCCA|nr:hypothetical protein ANCCAN_15779 [Ancylostoma caninum]